MSLGDTIKRPGLWNVFYKDPPVGAGMVHPHTNSLAAAGSLQSTHPGCILRRLSFVHDCISPLTVKCAVYQQSVSFLVCLVFLMSVCLTSCLFCLHSSFLCQACCLLPHWTWVYMLHACVHACAHAYACMHVCVCLCIHACMHVCMCVHAFFSDLQHRPGEHFSSIRSSAGG